MSLKNAFALHLSREQLEYGGYSAAAVEKHFQSQVVNVLDILCSRTDPVRSDALCRYIEITNIMVVDAAQPHRGVGRRGARGGARDPKAMGVRNLHIRQRKSA